MFILRRYTPTDREAVEYLHVHALKQSGAYLGPGPWDDDIYAIEETYLPPRWFLLHNQSRRCGIEIASGPIKTNN